MIKDFKGWVFSLLLLICYTLSFLTWIAPSYAGLKKTLHNLSPSGPGAFKAKAGADICIFCHTPHNARPARYLWNREMSAVTYNLYQSSTIEAALQQPTGDSRLCLSCHDGTVALGAVRRGWRPGAEEKESLGPLKGRASLGTDLSDDHPISFVYDAALVTQDKELADPSTLPKEIRLDEGKQLQCTSCHDAHEYRYPMFLVMDNRYSRLCISCHYINGWAGSPHATSAAQLRGAERDKTVAEEGCENCHKPHTAGHPERLLLHEKEEDNCLPCHNGKVATKDIEGEFKKLSHHPIESSTGIHDPKEDPLTISPHVECEDCHNPHRVKPAPGNPPQASGILEGVKGVNSSGGMVEEANFEYEICFKCHGVAERTIRSIVRADDTTNVRFEFDPSNPSYHPVETQGKSVDFNGLEPPWLPTSLIFCTDCHNSDSSGDAGGIGPRGPHGSRYEFILEREYQVSGVPIGESYQAYAMCYKCHNRAMLLRDQGGFPHRLHIVEKGGSCAVCHDAHGSRQYPALINFMQQERSGNPVVTGSGAGRLEFQSQGPGHGQCYLTCHGVNHDPMGY